MTTMTNTARVIHVKDMPNHPDAVYIGRAMPRQGLKGSPLANPFKIGPDGTRTEVIEKYRQWLEDRLEDRLVDSRRQNTLDHLYPLIGKPLACWCRRAGDERTENNACHGDVILEELDYLWPEVER